ncbi:MAG: Stk1 family PASTA domain-containing Ser/Thr kinase [Bacilli bacterium]|nr:Stk1 family PASTA domain-containing Ser/Thr kinase [Clostridium sp.]MDY2804726.1 Stk1 family PASTA domain-containing Ser/Thr kinase [Bacilli bacterium]
MLSKGQKINDRYEIIKTIGEGGMANVYLANDTILDRKVAIKVLRGDLSNDEKFIRRFKREALSVSNLSHPNIVEVYDVGEEDGNYYIVMEYIEGKTLKQLLQKRGALTLNEVIDIMTQLTDGLAHAHEAYIIHRDIKPQNIMIEDNGLVKITDFGIAMALNSTQLTQTNSVMGSVHYLPPEQANGKGSTVKSDIYSLGILMYELLTGSVPFKGDTAVEIALKHMKEKIPSIRKQNPTIPQSVENIVLKATAKNPKNRYDNVRDMYKDLQTALQRDNEKRLVYEYPENDLEETKVIPQVTKEIKQVIDKPTAKEEDSEDNSVLKEKDEKNKLPIILAVVLLGTLIVLAGVYLLITSKDVKEVKVPNVVGLTTEEAIKKIKEKGLEYTTKSEESTTVEEGKVIRTEPKAGSTRTKKSTITIVESSGKEYVVLEDYTGQNYYEIKGKLEAKGIKVEMKTKSVENASEYKDKKDNIISQEPAFNKDEETKLYANDSVVLYIPEVDVYPDMVAEKWTLSQVEDFVKEYNLTLDKSYKETDEVEEDIVLSQNRAVGDPIYEGYTLKITLSKKPEKKDDKDKDKNPTDPLLPSDEKTN